MDVVRFNQIIIESLMEIKSYNVLEMRKILMYILVYLFVVRNKMEGGAEADPNVQSVNMVRISVETKLSI